MYFFLKAFYFTAISSSSVKRLQIDKHRHMLLIITNTGDRLLRNINNIDALNDLIKPAK